MMLYDHILTLDDEVRLIWNAKTTLPKILFLLNRYMIPICMIIKTNGTRALLLHIIAFSECLPRFQRVNSLKTVR